METAQFSFEKGWMQVRNKDLQNCKRDLMQCLNITTNVGFRKRLKGEYEPRVSEYRAIEAVFSKYGVTDVWGRAEQANS
ncbi:MAG: hypothetical protein LUD50_03185 [Clostridia bacterium]|nr:hypothetical protein [Clostridia bacterium]